MIPVGQHPRTTLVYAHTLQVARHITLGQRPKYISGVTDRAVADWRSVDRRLAQPSGQFASLIQFKRKRRIRQIASSFQVDTERLGVLTIGLFGANWPVFDRQCPI